jgi:hypothetical protein
VAFQAYNIQLLPLDTSKVEEVGVAGYKKLLQKLSDSFTKAVQEKRLLQEAYTLVNDTYFCPFVIHPRDKYSVGSLVKFHKAETVQDLYTQEDLYIKSGTATPVSNIYLFRFLFDFKHHLLLIEESRGRLPAPAKMEKALTYFFAPVAERFFQEHSLTINLISEDKTLKKVLKDADGFSHIDVKLTFPNGPNVLPNALEELRGKNIHKVELSLSAAKNAQIPEPTSYMSALLEHVSRYGEATISYYKKVVKGPKEVFRRLRYSTKTNPKRVVVRQGVDEDDEDFLKRAFVKLTNEI